MIKAGDKPIKVERKVLEKHVEAYLVSRVRLIGGKAYKWASANVRGVPDRVVVLPGGEVWFVELKKDDRAKLSHHQKVFFEEMDQLGMDRVAVVRGKSGVDAWLKERGY